MICREEKIALISLIIVVIMLSGYAFFMETLGTEMFASVYSEDAGVGSLVQLSGMADNVKTTQAGGHVTASINGVKVFISGDVFCPDFAVGDYIRVRGIVDEYMNEVEIRALEVEILKKKV